jgi:predicted nucleic acid-binding protein
MAWCFVEEDDHYATAVLRSMVGDTTAIVPDNWRHEVANVLLVAVRQRRLDEARAISFLAKLRELSIGEGDVRATPEVLFDTGRRYGLESYDAAYLDLAIRTGLPLATSDVALRRAARRARVRMLSV